MRHITDGELHAYLDGAADLLPEGRGDQVRNHLDSCPVCRERLQDEKSVRDRSQGLLDSVAPPELPLPSFEEIRTRAGAAESVTEKETGVEGVGGRYRGPLRGAPLAWAATVVLALGVGWMGGEVWRGREGGIVADSYVPETTARPAAEVLHGGAEAMAEPEAPREASVVGGVEGEVREEAGQAAGSETAGRESLRRSRGALVGPVSSLQSVPAPSPAQKEGDPRELALENSLAVSGLRVLSVEWEEWIPGEKALHIRQFLPPSDTLELRYLGLLMGSELEGGGAKGELGAVADASAAALLPFPKVMEASLPQGWNQVVMRWGRGWVVGRAPMPEASLKALLLTLR